MGGEFRITPLYRLFIDWSLQEFVRIAMAKGDIQDGIVDEHSLLCFINYNAERPKRTRKGLEIPGTFIGAVGLFTDFL
jgi:hypothetical protein